MMVQNSSKSAEKNDTGTQGWVGSNKDELLTQGTGKRLLEDNPGRARPQLNGILEVCGPGGQTILKVRCVATCLLPQHMGGWDK